MINDKGETVSYYCDFNKIDAYKQKEVVPPDKIIIREIDGFGHVEVIRGVRKLNILT